MNRVNYISLSLFILALVSLTSGTESHMTDASVSTSTAFPASTPKPSPSDVFYVHDIEGKVCLVLRLEASFSIPYQNTKMENKTALIDLGKPSESHFEGKCYPISLQPEETIHISWRPKYQDTAEWMLSLYISQHSNLTFYVNSVKLAYILDSRLFPEAKYAGSQHTVYAVDSKYHNSTSVTLFETALGSYYQCTAEEKVPMEENVEMKVATIILNPFRSNRSDTTFVGQRSQCSTDAFASNIVPIIVGSCLAFLILLVLVTYLIGRRRSTRANYQAI